MKIIVTCGYDYSTHTLVLLRLLQKNGIQVDKCLIVSHLSLKRTRFYFRQLDFREFQKKLKDRILRNITDVQVSDEMKPVLRMKNELNITETKVSDFCKNHGIDYKIVKNLNSAASLQFIGKADLGIYSGGGILGSELLNSFKTGVLNCHSAKLPELRGMNVAEWSVLLGIPLQKTLHFMVRDLDLGPILTHKLHRYPGVNSINELRGSGLRYTVLDLLEGVKKIIGSDYKTVSQSERDGKQYFPMHPRLKAIVNKKLAQHEI